MTVPETAVNKDSRSVLAHDDVRLAGYALDIEPVSVPVCPQPSSHDHFRLGRFAAYMRHAAMALSGCENIGHKELLSIFVV